MFPCGQLKPYFTGECTFWHLFVSVARTVNAFKNHSIFIYSFCFELFVFFCTFAFPHLISLCLGTLPSALFSPPSSAPASACIYSCKSIYCSFSGGCSCWSLIPKLNGLWLFLAQRGGRDVWVELVLFLPDFPSNSGVAASDAEQPRPCSRCASGRRQRWMWVGTRMFEKGDTTATWVNVVYLVR